jgi:hypothetical protein
VKVGVGKPFHEPVDALRTWPSVVVPLIAGREVLAGEVPEILAVAALEAAVVPEPDVVPVALTTARTAKLTSAFCRR